MKQCIAEVLETQSEIIQLQRNVIDRRAGPGRFFYFAENGAERNTKKWTI